MYISMKINGGGELRHINEVEQFFFCVSVCEKLKVIFSEL